MYTWCSYTYTLDDSTSMVELNEFGTPYPDLMGGGLYVYPSLPFYSNFYKSICVN